MNLPRLLRTISHLKAQQIVGQVKHRLQRVIESPEAFSKQKAPAFPGVHWSPDKPFHSPSPRESAVDEILGGRFTFINRTELLGVPIDWQIDTLPKLWLYNLHYFEYLWSLRFEDARMLAGDWISRHPLRKNAIGWEPYPTSLRLMNFCCFFFHRYREQTEADVSFRDALWQSIHLQAQWLLKHLEIHLLGNHYLENAAALTVVGRCFAQSQWTKCGRAILEEQLTEQILPDGGHIERSPMYQARVVYLLELLWNVGVMDILPRLQSAGDFLSAAMHPDEDIALLNDAAFGVCRTDLKSSLNRPATFEFPDTGYFGARTIEGHYVICDAAPLGPDYLPGHAHADIFTFELSLFGQRVIVDTGTFDYEVSETRRLTRSTAAHNSVEIDGHDQAEMWAAFRVGRRGRPRDVKFERLDDGFRLTGWHDGYRWLRGSPVHRRSFRFRRTGMLSVEDAIESSATHRAVSRLHLHPSVNVKQLAAGEAEIHFPGGRALIVFTGTGNLRVEKTFYYPEFSRAEANRTLAYEWTSCGRSTSGFVILPKGNNTVDERPVNAVSHQS